VTLHYRGTSVVWRALAGPNAGKARVKLDGTAVGTFDLYAASPGYVDITLTYAGIADTLHDLAIVVLGSKRGASADTLVTLRQLTLS
jgi:hypothetical protein